jgi:hypothetical protein
MSEIEKQFNYYLAHQDDLVKKYNGRHVVIVGEQVVRDFDTEVDAYKYASGNYEPGTFMIQLVTPGDESYSQTFYSRVAI